MTAFRHTALAAGLLAASFGVLAAPVQITFDDIGQTAVANGAPVKISTVQGINFSGAYVYDTNMASAIGDPQPGPGNAGGYVVNRGRGTNPEELVISLEDILNTAVTGAAAGSSFPNQYFSSITFSMFTRAASPILRWYDIGGHELGHKDLVAGGPGMSWSDGNVADFNAQDKVTKLVFSGAGAVLGMDNLSITLTDPGTGGNAPEPASYALVGAALLAAGAATRRRRS